MEKYKQDKNPVLLTCIPVAKRNPYVSINNLSLDILASDLAQRRIVIPPWTTPNHLKLRTFTTQDQEILALYALVLDTLQGCFWAQSDKRWQYAINGKKLNGYIALSTALRIFFEKNYPNLNIKSFSQLTFEKFKQILQGGKNLIFLKERWKNLLQVCAQVEKKYGSVSNFIKSAHSLASRLAIATAKLPSFSDSCLFRGKKVFFYKRAQIFVADIYGAFGSKGLGSFTDIDWLSAFADYKVPQYFEYKKVLRYAPILQRKIHQKILIPRCSGEEVSIRACTIFAVELLKLKLKKLGKSYTSLELDWILWSKAVETKMNRNHHLTKTLFY